MNQFDTPAPVATRPVRVAYFVSHPIQYQAPLLRHISRHPDIDLTVYFSSDCSVREYLDGGFGVKVKWDVPLLEGYKYEFLPRIRDTDNPTVFAKPLNWGVFKRLRKGRFDAVWLFGYNRLLCYQVMFAAKLLGIPVILQGESNLDSRKRPFNVRLAKRMLAPILKSLISCVVPIGTLNERYWKSYFGEDFPAFRMPYSIDNEFFRQRALESEPSREQLRAQLGLEPGRPVILYASKLQTRKRCIDLVEAFLQLSPSPGADPDAYLLIVGDGPERPALEQRVREAGVSSIRFLGFKNQTELPAIYDLCDAFVLPSIHETWGLIVNELMSVGRPIVVTDRVGCQTDLVHDGVNGFVYPVGNVAALSRCLRRLFDDPALRASMGEQSRRIIRKHSYDEDLRGLRQALAFITRQGSAKSAKSNELPDRAAV